MFLCDRCGCCCRNLDKSELYAQLDRGDGTCRYLSGNICSIYENRPLLCRIDECYETYYHKIMDRNEYDNLNMEECKILKKLEG